MSDVLEVLVDATDVEDDVGEAFGDLEVQVDEEDRLDAPRARLRAGCDVSLGSLGRPERCWGL